MLLDVSYSKHLGTLRTRVSVWSIWVFILVWATQSTGAETNVHCCPEGLMWLHSMNCTNGTRIQLNCPYGSYLVDPNVYESDNFTVLHEENTAWLLLNNERIPSDSFCVADPGNGNPQVALVCFDDEFLGNSSVWKDTLFCILSIISAIFLIITLAVYVLLPELREVQDKAMMAAVTSLAVSYIVLSIQDLRNPNDDDVLICVALGVILYFGFISVFFWLNIVAFNIWRSVWFKNFIIRDKPLFMIYCIYGWGGPFCFLTTVLITHHIDGNHLKPGFGEKSCWFSGPQQMWAYFYGPIAILLTLNVIYLGLTSWRLWHQYRDYSGSKLRALRFKCLLYVKLMLVMGITWIFEVLSFADGSKNDFWMPTDILNALQGLIIFLLLVATRKRVRKLLAKKRPCGIGFPKSWVAYEDEECEVVLPEELELSQQA